MPTDLILGTAGHIDHGKTSLVRALTGIDTDRLPEEKRRGITIELGFAELAVDQYRLGIVDVPGHERLVRTMLAGATGMDLAILVVAADDSVKPQTREHLEILRLLDLKAGVIAMTKCDLPEPDWIELVEEEIRELVQGSFLASAPIVRTSTATGQGLDELRKHLLEAARRVAETRTEQQLQAPFRMAIDRAFTIAGHGTVVTGSISSGSLRTGEELVIEPGSIRVRVRSLQNHDRAVDEVHRGQRAALNLVGVHHEAIRRGQELAAPGHLAPSRVITAQISLLSTAPRALKSRTRVRVHVGTAELLASVVLLESPRLQPGGTAAAQLLLSEPAVMTWNQPLVLRSESPVVTIGGGRVLDPAAERIRRPDAQVLEMVHQLASPEPLPRASAALYFAGLRDWQPRDLARTAGIDAYDDVAAQLDQRGDLCALRLSPTRTLRVHRLVLERLGQRVVALLKKMHALEPLRTTLDRSRLVSRLRYLGDDSLVDAVLEDLRARGQIQLGPRSVALAGHGPQLSQNERKLLHQLVEQYRTAGLETPSVKQMQQQASKNQDSVPQLIELAAANGQLVRVSSDYYLHADVESDIRQKLTEHLADSSGATLSQIREVLGTTRKYAVPLCEYLDRVGFTRRQGDLRMLNHSPADTAVEAESRE